MTTPESPRRAVEIRGAYAARSSWNGPRIWLILAAAVVVVLGLGLAWRWPRQATVGNARLTIALQRVDGSTLTVHELALSPDGRHLVFLAADGRARRLYLRSIDGSENSR